MTVASISGRTESHVFPIGTIIAWPHSGAVPAGWLLCDGSPQPVSAYPELYNIITKNGTTFPFGANVGSTFLLPSLNNNMPRSPSTTTPPSGANSNVGVKVTGSSHAHTWDLKLSVTQSAADGGHGHNATYNNSNSGSSSGHTFTASLGAATNSATAVIFGLSGNTGSAYRAHDHNSKSHSWGSGNHSHSHSTSRGNNVEHYISATHSHTWGTTGNSYNVVSNNEIVNHISTRYIIFAKPSGER